MTDSNVKHEVAFQRELSDIVKQRESLGKNLHNQTREIAKKLLSNSKSDGGVSAIVSKTLGKVLEDLGTIDKKYSEKRNSLESKRQRVLGDLAKANDKTKESILKSLRSVESSIRENESKNAKNLIEQIKVQKDLEKAIKTSAKLSESSIGKLLLKDSKKKAIEDLVNRKKEFKLNRKDILEGLRNQQSVLEATGASPQMLRAIQSQIKAVVEKDVLKFEKIEKTVSSLHSSIEDEFARDALERAKDYRRSSLAERLLGKTIAGGLSSAKSKLYDRTIGSLGSKIGSIGYKGINLRNASSLIGGALSRRSARNEIEAFGRTSGPSTNESVSKVDAERGSREELNQLIKINKNLEGMSVTGSSSSSPGSGFLSTITEALESLLGKGTVATLTSVLGGGLKTVARFLGPLGAVTAAGAIGYGVGSLIYKYLSEDTKNVIGSSIAKVLAFFGNEEATKSLDINEPGTPSSSPKGSRTSTPASGLGGGRGSGGVATPGIPTGSRTSTPASGLGGGRGSGGVATPSTLASLVTVSGGDVDLDGLQPAMSSRLQGAARDYTAATGKKLQVNSAKRSHKKQAELYAKGLAGTGNPANAPGTSFHEIGLASDVQPDQVDEMQRLGILQKNGLERINRPGEKQHLQISGANELSKKAKGSLFSGDASVESVLPSSSSVSPPGQVNQVSGSPLSLSGGSGSPSVMQSQTYGPYQVPTSGNPSSGKVDATTVPTFMFNDPEFYAHNLSVM